MPVPPKATSIMELESHLDAKMLQTVKERLELLSRIESEDYTSPKILEDLKTRAEALEELEVRLFQAWASLQSALEELHELLN